MRIDMLLARADLIEMARPSVDYCRDNRIDFAATVPVCGGVFLAGIRLSDRWFDPDPNGILGVWCDVLAEDAETVIDVAAWPANRPDQVKTLGGVAPALGMAHAANPSTYTFERPLQLFRTPLAWLQARCDGAVLLDQTAGGRWLINLPASTLTVEDWKHGGDIKRIMSNAATKRIVVPEPARRAA